MDRIKIGQIGIGHNHGEGKMKAVRKFPELFEVVGYAEENEEWVKARGGLAAYEGVPRLSVAEVIEKSDAVLVECDVWNLTKYASLCVAAGKHVHMDKPASGTLSEYKALLDAAKTRGLVLQLGYMYRYNPAVKRIFALAQSGELGKIHSVNAEMSTRHPAEYRRWLQNFDGGVMYIFGSHLVDLIVYLLGKPEKVTSFSRPTFADGVACVDNALAVLEYDGAIARVYVSSVEVNGWGNRQLVVCGSKATAKVLPLENPITMTYADLGVASDAYLDLKNTVEIADLDKGARYDEMMSDFAAYVRREKENPFSYEHDLAVQEVLSKIVDGMLPRGKYSI